MPLNNLTLTNSSGIIGRRFKSRVNGLTAGTERRVSSGNAGGFYMQGDFLCNDALTLEAQGVTIVERSLTESRSTTVTVNARYTYVVATVEEDGTVELVGGGGSGAPTSKTATASTSGVVYTVQRLLGSTSTLSLVTGSSSNLSINSTTGAISAASAIAVGASQTANVREANNGLAVEYPVVITGVSAAPAPTPTPTPGPTLKALSVTPAQINTGTFATVNINDATDGSVINGTPPDGMTLNSGSRTITGVPTVAGTFSINLTETLEGADGSPRTSTASLQVVQAASNALVASPNTVSIPADAAVGYLIANITNVPSGVTPTVSPNDGRFAIGGNASAGWKVVTGLSALAAGSVNLTVAASGAAPATIALTITPASNAATTYKLTSVQDAFIEQPATMTSGLGPYWPDYVDMRNTGFPADYAMYFSTDHASGFGGIWLYVCRGEPTTRANWKSYDEALALGWFDGITDKPAGNPIISGDTKQNPAGFTQLETPRVRKVGSTWYMNLQANNVQNKRNNQATIQATSPDGVQWLLPASLGTVLLVSTTNFGFGDGHTGYFTCGDNPFPALVNPATNQPWKYLGYSLDGGTDKAKFGQWASDDWTTWTQLAGLHSPRGRIFDQLSKGLGWYIDVPSIRRINDDMYSAVVGGTAGGSSSAPQYGTMFETVLDKFGREHLAEPKVILDQAAGARAQGPSVPRVMIDTPNNRFLASWYASDANNKNSIGFGSGPLVDPATTQYTILQPNVNGPAVTVQNYDFTALSALPAAFSFNSDGEAASAISFSPTNGLRVTSPAMANNIGNLWSLVYKDGIVPNDLEYFEIYVTQNRNVSSGSASRHLLIGFGDAATGMRESQTKLVGFGNAKLDGSGSTTSAAYQLSRFNGVDAAVSDNFSGFGGGSSSKATVSYGIRWFPKLGKIYFLGESRAELRSVPIPTGLDLNQRLYPHLFFRTYLTSNPTIEQFKAITVRTKTAS